MPDGDDDRSSVAMSTRAMTRLNSKSLEIGHFFFMILVVYLGHGVFYPGAVLFFSRSVFALERSWALKLRNLRKYVVHLYRRQCRMLSLTKTFGLCPSWNFSFDAAHDGMAWFMTGPPRFDFLRGLCTFHKSCSEENRLGGDAGRSVATSRKLACPEGPKMNATRRGHVRRNPVDALCPVRPVHIWKTCYICFLWCPAGFSWQATGLLEDLEAVKAVHVEPRGQGKIDGVLAEYYVSMRPLSFYGTSVAARLLL